MIGSKCSSYENALAALKAVKASGYDGIELNEFMVKPTPALVRLLTKFAGMPTGNSGKLDWHRLIKESGLKVISLHSYLNSIEEKVLEIHKNWIDKDPIKSLQVSSKWFIKQKKEHDQ